MILRFLPILAGSVIADYCQDICKQQIGPEACSGGTWCEEGFNCHGLYWTSPAHTSMCYSTGSDDDCPTELPVICTLKPMVPLHRTRTDPSPHVRAKFIGHPGLSPNTTFELLFDTGSCPTRVPLQNVSSATIGYEDRLPEGAHVRSSWRIPYGCAYQASVRVIHTVRERMQLLNGDFDGTEELASHLTDLCLTDPVDSYLGENIYGGNRDSALAQEMGIFTLVPSQVAGNAGPVGWLVIGERNETVLDSFCARGTSVVWVPTTVEGSHSHWVVGGNVSIEGAISDDRQPISDYWLLDTGFHPSHVCWEVYNSTVAAIRATGSLLDDYVSSDIPVNVHNCTDENWSRYPTLIFSLGDGVSSSPFTVRMKPADYLARRSGTERCWLYLQPAFIDLELGRRVRLLGIDFLTKVVTTFDLDGDRVGFCRSPHSRP